MGLFERLFGQGEQSASTDSTEQATDSISVSEGIDDWINIEYQGERFHVQFTESPNGEYMAAYQDGRSSDDEPIPGRVFLLENETLRFTSEIGRPNECAVANSGTVAIVDWNLDWGDELSGTFHVFSREGDRLLRHEFDANLSPAAITPDGRYAATSTLNPDCSTYVFALEDGELVLEHENQEGNVMALEFVATDDSWNLRLGDPEDDSSYLIDLTGGTVEEGERDG